MADFCYSPYPMQTISLRYKMRHCYVFIVIFVLSGCAARVVSSSTTGVAIDPIMIYPNMTKIQQLANSECAKYGRIAVIDQGGRSSSDRPVGTALSALEDPTGLTPARSRINMLIAPLLRFKCVDRPTTIDSSPAWPQLQ